MKIRLRVTAIIFKSIGEILLVNHKKQGESYWVLPGGGVEFGESLEAAIIREIKEELGLKIKVQELIFIGESIPDNGQRHSVDIYFRTKPISKTIKFKEDKILKDYSYFPLDSLNKIDFRPSVVEQLIKDVFSGKLIKKVYIGNTWL